MAEVGALGVDRDLLDEGGTWSDERHLTPEHVEELRQLVEGQRRRTRPTGVTRGSCRIFRQMPSRSLSDSSAARRASASRYIERNLIIPKVVPRRAPRVSCTKEEPARVSQAPRPPRWSSRNGPPGSASRSVEGQETNVQQALGAHPDLKGARVRAISALVRAHRVRAPKERGSGSETASQGSPGQRIAHHGDSCPLRGRPVETADLCKYRRPCGRSDGKRQHAHIRGRQEELAGEGGSCRLPADRTITSKERASPSMAVRTNRRRDQRGRR